MPRNDQPFLTFNYNTDQFTDPVYGFTVHDDGSPTYTQPQTGVLYNKLRIYNGQSCSGYTSYDITLVSNILTNDAGTIVLTNDSGGLALTVG